MNAVLSAATIGSTGLRRGDAMYGGFLAGLFLMGGRQHGLIVSPKAFGDFADVAWHPNYKDAPGATSLVDGLANTRAMAEVGCPLAEKILALPYEQDGATPWFLGAVDQVEVAFRAFNPTANQNSGWYRSGINLSAVPPTWPYTVQPASQTDIEAFKAGGAEAFEPTGYWTSTQHASFSDYAWFQDFDDGTQHYWLKSSKLRGRAFRSFVI